MSDAPPTPAAAPALPTMPPVDSLKSPQFLIACMLIALVAYVVAMVFQKGSDALINTVVGMVIGVLGTVAGFYYQSSVGSQRKDAQAQQPTTTGAAG